MRFGCAQNGGSCARASTELVPCVLGCVDACVCMTSASHTARAVPVPPGGTEHVPRPSTPTRAQRALHPRCCCYTSASGERRIPNQCESKRGREGASGGSEPQLRIGCVRNSTLPSVVTMATYGGVLLYLVLK